VIAEVAHRVDSDALPSQEAQEEQEGKDSPNAGPLGLDFDEQGFRAQGVTKLNQ
jgi:hypothetical protein